MTRSDKRQAWHGASSDDAWPRVVRGGILMAGVLSTWGLALTALHLL